MNYELQVSESAAGALQPLADVDRMIAKFEPHHEAAARRASGEEPEGPVQSSGSSEPYESLAPPTADAESGEPVETVDESQPDPTVAQDSGSTGAGDAAPTDGAVAEVSPAESDTAEPENALADQAPDFTAMVKADYGLSIHPVCAMLPPMDAEQFKTLGRRHRLERACTEHHHV
jgi:hypothetical protein